MEGPVAAEDFNPRQLSVADCHTKMNEISIRKLLKASAAVGIAGVVPQSAGKAAAQPSPDLERYIQPLPIPEVRNPDGKRKGAEYHDVSITESIS